MNGPQRPGEHPNEQPPNVATGQGGGLNLREEIREVSVAPVATDDLSEAAPKKLGGHAREKDVIRGFRSPTEGADTITGTLAPQDLHARGKPATDPLPHEDSNLEGDANRPYGIEDAWSGSVCDGAVE